MIYFVLFLLVANIALLPVALVCSILFRNSAKGFVATTWLLCGLIVVLMGSSEIGYEAGIMLAFYGPTAIPILSGVLLFTLPLFIAPILLAAISAAIIAANTFKTWTTGGALRANIAFFATAWIASETLVTSVMRINAETATNSDYCLWRTSAYHMFENWLSAGDAITDPHAVLVADGVVYSWSFRNIRFEENATRYVADGRVAACNRQLR